LIWNIYFLLLNYFVYCLATFNRLNKIIERFTLIFRSKRKQIRKT